MDEKDERKVLVDVDHLQELTRNARRFLAIAKSAWVEDRDAGWHGYYKTPRPVAYDMCGKKEIPRRSFAEAVDDYYKLDHDGNQLGA